MSAHTELLLEQIKYVEAQLAEANVSGSSPTTVAELAATLTKLQQKLSSATEALTEGKSVLKG